MLTTLPPESMNQITCHPTGLDALKNSSCTIVRGPKSNTDELIIMTKRAIDDNPYSLVGEMFTNLCCATNFCSSFLFQRKYSSLACFVLYQILACFVQYYKSMEELLTRQKYTMISEMKESMSTYIAANLKIADDFPVQSVICLNSSMSPAITLASQNQLGEASTVIVINVWRTIYMFFVNEYWASTDPVVEVMDIDPTSPPGEEDSEPDGINAATTIVQSIRQKHKKMNLLFLVQSMTDMNDRIAHYAGERPIVLPLAYNSWKLGMDKLLCAVSPDRFGFVKDALVNCHTSDQRACSVIHSQMYSAMSTMVITNANVGTGLAMELEKEIMKINSITLQKTIPDQFMSGAFETMVCTVLTYVVVRFGRKFSSTSRNKRINEQSLGGR